MSEQLARKFHETYERLAREFGYETRDDTKRFDPDSPNGRLMIAVCRELQTDLAAEREAALEAENERLREVLKELRNAESMVTHDWDGRDSLLDRVDKALAKHKQSTATGQKAERCNRGDDWRACLWEGLARISET